MRRERKRGDWEREKRKRTGEEKKIDWERIVRKGRIEDRSDDCKGR